MKTKALATSILILTSSFCNAGPHDWINEDKSPPYEFPWPDGKLLDAFDVSPYPVTLKNQPEKYRLFYLPPFSPPFLIVVTPNKNQTCSIQLRRLSGTGGYPDEYGEIDYDDIFEISKGQTRELLGKLRKDEVYTVLAGLTAIQTSFLESIDGTSVIIERTGKDGHSVARVSSPESLVNEIENLINKQGLSVYRKINLLPFLEAFKEVAEVATFEFGPYGAVSIKRR